MDRRIGVGLVVLSLALGLLAVSAQAQPPKGNLSPRQRGLNYAGLNAKGGGHCEGLYRVETDKGPISCTHGPDRGPIDVDVTEQRSVADLADTATGALERRGRAVHRGRHGRRSGAGRSTRWRPTGRTERPTSCP